MKVVKGVIRRKGGVISFKFWERETLERETSRFHARSGCGSALLIFYWFNQKN
jgi:hypothetical protein